MLLFHWHTWDDIFQYSLSLHNYERTGILVVLSAVCWVIWKYRNDLCFNDCTTKSARSIILLIKSIVDYWTCTMKNQAKTTAKLWVLVIEDAIPLDVIPPDMEIVMYRTGVSTPDE